MVPVRSLASSVAGSVVGGALGGVFRVVAAVRPAAKPLHPRGTVRRARLHRNGLEPPVGVAFVDATATDDVVVRESRAAGLPSSLPDVHGLALRVPGPGGGHSDVLFATNGFGRLTRYLLVPTWHTYGRPMTTLLPYESDAGPVLLGVHEVDEGRLELVCSVGGGPWRAFGELVLSDDESDDNVSFDAVRNTPPGLRQYAAVRRIREPAYAAARAERSAP
jgi:hypothetical protein